MNILKKKSLYLLTFLFLLVTAPTLSLAAEAEIGDNGLHIQSWFLDSFLDLKDDHETATDNGKHLAIIFEQRACPYCAELHKNNFKQKEIISYLGKHFEVIQLDLWGSRQVTDFDGKEVEERQLARRWRVNFTPTMVFLPKDKSAVEGKIGSKVEIFRMPGYFKPFHFLSMLEFINEEEYKKVTFQRYLQAKFKKLKEKGIKPKVW